MIIEFQKTHPFASAPSFIKKGDWIDLAVPEDYEIPQITHSTQVKDLFVDFGIAMKLPPGYEAIIAARSSTFRNYGLVLSNGIGIIDGSYCGPNDSWKAHFVVLQKVSAENSIIKGGTRIAQFRIQLSQKATIWQKIKALFIKPKFKEVTFLKSPNRGGYGSTGK